MIDDDMMAPVDVFYRLVKHDVDLVAPLARAADAILIDTTSMPVPQVVERVMDIVRSRG